MRKICSGIISCFVAAAMVVTSAGMPVMADTLLVDETKGCEVLKETDELIPDEPDADAIDNGVLTYADEPLADIEETTDKENNDTESETVSSADDENDPDAKIGLPIDLPDGSDRGNTGNDRKPVFLFQR